MTGETQNPGTADGPLAAVTADPLMRCFLRLAREFGRLLSEAEIRAAAHVPATGMTVESIERAAPRLGFRAKRMTAAAADLAAVPLPFVLLGAGGARVVLARQGDMASIYDGAGDTERTAPLAEPGVTAASILLLRPAGALAAPRNWRTLFLRKVRPIMLEVALASLAVNILALAWPLFTMTLYNKVIGQRALATLDVLALGMLSVFTFDAALRGLRGYVSAHTAARLDAFIGGEVMHHVLGLPYRQFEATTSGVMAERLNQLDVLRSFFAGQLPLLIVDLAFVVLFLALLAFIHPLVAAATLAAMPLIAGVPFLGHRAQGTLIEQSFAARAAKATALSETIANALTIKSLGLEPEIERRWDARLALAAWTGFRTSNISNGARAVAGLMANLLGLIILFAGARLVIEGEISLGALIACSILAQRAVAPIGALSAGWHGIREVAAAFRRVDALMALPAEHGGGAPVAPTGGTLMLEQVGFAFAPDRPPVLREVTLAAAPGQIVGVIGPSGSGKSTLVRVMQGLYRPGSGRVLIDDTDIAHLAPEALRQQIGVVPQEVQLFSGTVRENIALAVPSKDPERVVAVARFVGAHDFIQRLPEGYETVLGERGIGISAGQRQLIAVARALMRNPRIILLDEATSALDPVAEETLLRNLRRVSRGRTIVLVTHRLAPLAFCDRVALMIDGAITRLGAPAEVVAFARSQLGEAAQR